jgi:hypothetical protein
MKRLSLLLIVLTLSLVGYSQIIVYPNSGIYGVGYNRIVPLNTLWLPTGCGVPTGKTSLNAPGTNPRQAAVYTDTCGHHIYWYDPSDSGWSRIDTGGGGGGAGTVTAILISNDSLYYTTSSGNTFVAIILEQYDSTIKYVTPTQLNNSIAALPSVYNDRTDPASDSVGGSVSGSALPLRGIKDTSLDGSVTISVISNPHTIYHNFSASGGGSSPPFSDANPIAKNASDATKLFQYSLGGLTTGTTVVETIPASSYTSAGINLNQTWSGKPTLTAGLQLNSNVTYGTTNAYQIGSSGNVSTQVWSRSFNSDGQLTLSAPAGATIQGQINGVPKFEVLNTGQIQLGGYGSGAFTGTAVYAIGETSAGNLIETSLGGIIPPNIGTGVNVYAPQIPGFRRITALAPLTADTTTTTNSITIQADTASSTLTNLASYQWILNQGYTNFLWVNVKSAPYNAYGDGIHDDTYAIQMAAAACGSGGAVLYFPPGRYIVSGTIRLPYKVQVLGCGGSNAGIFNSVTPSTAFYRDSTTDITQIWSTSASDTVFVLGGSGSSISGMNIVLAPGVTATSTNVGIYGAGTSLKLKDMGVGSFYNCVDDTAAVEVTISDVFIWNPVNYGIWMQNRKNADGGDNSCIQSFFYAGNNNTRAMVRLENGGWKFMQNKWNANAGYSGEAQIGIWLEIYGSAGSTSDLNLSGNSYENISDTVIYLHASGGGIFYNAQIEGEQISTYSSTSSGVVENGLSGWKMDNCIVNEGTGAGTIGVNATDPPQTFVANLVNGYATAVTPAVSTSSFFMSNVTGLNTLLNLSGSYSGLMNAGITNTSASGYISWNVFGSGSNGAIIRTYGPSFSVSSLRNIALFSGTQNVMLGSITSGYPTNIVGGSTTPLITATGALVQFPQIASNIIDSTNFKVAVIRQSDQSIFQTNWPTFGSGGSGVTSFGTPTTSYANGATVSGTTAYLGLASSSNPGIIAGSGAQTLGATLTLSNALTVNAAISTSSTHGVNISAKNDLTSQSGAGTITSYAVPGSGSNNNFQISAYINILSIVTDILQVQVTFTGEDNASHTVTFYSQGVTSANLTSTGYYPFPPIFVSVKQGTTITASVVFTTGTGSVTYDAGAIITQMY